MPLAAYFRNVGAALLALLMIADFFLPTTLVAQRGVAQPPVVRIHSDGKWPEPVILDTTQVVIAAAAPSPWDKDPPILPAAREMPASRADGPGARDALALMPRQDSHRATSVEKRKRQVTRKHPKPQIVLAARQGQFAWFGFRNW